MVIIFKFEAKVQIIGELAKDYYFFLSNKSV